MDISIIIVSYNTADLIGNCLRSVMATNPMEKDVFVIDDALSDGSAAIVKESLPSCHLMVNPENKGFAAANNQALPYCRGRYIFFLNPDTQVMPDTFLEALSFMEANPHYGLAGARIIAPDGTLQESVSYRYPGQKYATDELTGLKGSIACVLGAGMIAEGEILFKGVPAIGQLLDMKEDVPVR